MHHALVLVDFVGVNSLRMLTQVIEARELLPAVAGERSLSSVFPDVPGKMLAPAEYHATFSVSSALERLGRGGTVTLGSARNGLGRRRRGRRGRLKKRLGQTGHGGGHIGGL